MPSKLILLSSLAISLLGGFAAGPAGAADAFYLRLLERGVQDLELGLAAEARQKLRTASFGFLDEPVLLAEALMQLGRAQILNEDSEELTDTVMRLVEIENRFGAYSAADSEIKMVFESALQSALPEALLTRLPLFEHLVAVPEPAESPAQARTPKQRKKALEARLAADPNDGAALLDLSRLHYTSGKLKPAAEYLDRFLALRSDDQDALCLRADIAIDRKECAPALAGVDSCPSLTASDRAAVLVIDCLTATGRTAEATTFLDRLPADLRQSPKVTRATRKFASTVESNGTESTALPSGGETIAEPVPESEGAAPPQSAQPPQASPTETTVTEPREERLEHELEQRILALRTQVQESRFREQLQDALQQAITLATEYPNSPQAQYLAAEVAYLAADWPLVLEYFARAPRPGGDRPELLFYLAVATFETGNGEEAASILREAMPQLARNPFVDGYIDKILSPPPS